MTDTLILPTLSAIIFDFDGVIADTEALHFASFHQTLAEIGIVLTEADYYANYLGYDDRGCFLAALTIHQRPPDPSTLSQLMQRKAQAYLESVKDRPVIFPGVREFVYEAAEAYPLAIASGALRNEIEYILEQTGLRKEFLHITSAEDVTKGKPDPQSFLHALEALNQCTHTHLILPESCLVIEDSIPGLRGAKTARMKVLAVATTHTLEDLHEAHEVTQSLAQVHLRELRERLWPSSGNSVT